jgi:hypothetical protein
MLQQLGLDPTEKVAQVVQKVLGFHKRKNNNFHCRKASQSRLSKRLRGDAVSVTESNTKIDQTDTEQALMSNEERIEYLDYSKAEITVPFTVRNTHITIWSLGTLPPTVTQHYWSTAGVFKCNLV